MNGEAEAMVGMNSRGVAEPLRGRRERERNCGRIERDGTLMGGCWERNLAVLAVEREDIEEAVRQWRAILEERPGDGEALDQLRRLGALDLVGSG